MFKMPTLHWLAEPGKYGVGPFCKASDVQDLIQKTSDELERLWEELDRVRLERDALKVRVKALESDVSFGSQNTVSVNS